MDDVTRYVLIAALVLGGWFAIALALGYVFHRHVERRKRLFSEHETEADQ